MTNILLVEDDVTLGETLYERLQKKGYGVTWAKSQSEASKSLQEKNFSLAILDVGLPDGSGFALAKQFKTKSNTPIIFLTAMASAEYRLQGFELGAEEYIPKPFHLKELFLRVQHVLDNHAPKKLVTCGKNQIDFERMAILRKTGELEYLPTKDFNTLKLLIQSSPRVVSRDEILNTVWGEEKFPSNRTVDNVIVRLRAILQDDGNIIRSVRGVGYQWQI